MSSGGVTTAAAAAFKGFRSVGCVCCSDCVRILNYGCDDHETRKTSPTHLAVSMVCATTIIKRRRTAHFVSAFDLGRNDNNIILS